jgi:AcrR family transcriptional regulator
MLRLDDKSWLARRFLRRERATGMQGADIDAGERPPEEPVGPSAGLSLSELVARTGVPASTVHYYLRLGLVPRPARSARNRFCYDERHVTALRVVRLLRDRQALSLEEIAARLPDALGRADLGARLADADPEGEAADPEGEADVAARLVDVAIDAFSQHGFAEVTVADLAAAAGVAKGSVYRHFGSKEELFAAAVDRVLAQTADAFRQVVQHLGGPGRVTEVPEQAAAELADPVARALPVLMELGARAAKGHRGSRRLAQRVLRTLAAAAGGPGADTALPGAPNESVRAGLDVIVASFAVVLAWALEPPEDPLLAAAPPGPSTPAAAGSLTSTPPGAYNR